MSNALSGDKIDYRTSGAQTVRLDVPPDLSQLPGQSRFTQVSPAIVTASSLGQQAPGAQAEASQVAPNKLGGVRLERQGQTRWLVVDQSPDQVFERVRGFWVDNGFELAVDRPEAGLLETSWAENRAKVQEDGIRRLLGSVFDRLYDSGERDQFRTRIERTATGSEIYITHRGLIEEFEDQTRKERTTWRARPSDTNLEAEMLSRLMVRLGAPKEQAASARDAVAAKPDAKQATLATLGADGTTVMLRGEPELAWRRVGLALDRSGFTVEGRDRAAGLYEVRMAVNDPEASKPGFFSRLFGASAKEETLARYQVRVVNQGRDTQVSVQTEAGQPASNETGKRIARRLADELN
ncbi:MAG: outer membrane protein assembly factor BamC [Burkholderiales bacterium]|nr:outer membrane protein assembly factor BamC [Burkholderiales bacterium]MBH2016919.1 outer membrane protein assembly factor BamC [Burkholderiales bacterium]